MDRREYASSIRCSWESFLDDNPRIRIRMIVCPSCSGKGSYVNPSIDSNGISSNDECWEDDDFSSNYSSGYYDVTCEYCNGNNVVAVPEDNDLFREWEKRQQECISYCMESNYERQQMSYYY